MASNGTEHPGSNVMQLPRAHEPVTCTVAAASLFTARPGQERNQAQCRSVFIRTPADTCRPFRWTRASGSSVAFSRRLSPSTCRQWNLCQ